jgi:hypothetical protein
MYVTPMVEDRECAYVTFDEKGITKCGIEKAYEDGAIDWQKPISCHLYPIRITEYSTFTALITMNGVYAAMPVLWKRIAGSCL